MGSIADGLNTLSSWPSHPPKPTAGSPHYPDTFPNYSFPAFQALGKEVTALDEDYKARTGRLEEERRAEAAAEAAAVAAMAGHPGYAALAPPGGVAVGLPVVAPHTAAADVEAGGPGGGHEGETVADHIAYNAKRTLLSRFSAGVAAYLVADICECAECWARGAGAGVGCGCGCGWQPSMTGVLVRVVRNRAVRGAGGCFWGCCFCGWLTGRAEERPGAGTHRIDEAVLGEAWERRTRAAGSVPASPPPQPTRSRLSCSCCLRGFAPADTLLPCLPPSPASPLPPSPPAQACCCFPPSSTTWSSPRCRRCCSCATWCSHWCCWCCSGGEGGRGGVDGYWDACAGRVARYWGGMAGRQRVRGSHVSARPGGRGGVGCRSAPDACDTSGCPYPCRLRPLVKLAAAAGHTCLTQAIYAISTHHSTSSPAPCLHTPPLVLLLAPPSLTYRESTPPHTHTYTPGPRKPAPT